MVLRWRDELGRNRGSITDRDFSIKHPDQLWSLPYPPTSFCPGLKQLGHVADLWPPYSAEVKNERSYKLSPAYAFMVSTQTTLPLLQEGKAGERLWISNQGVLNW
jgi:hypothetical protein